MTATKLVPALALALAVGWISSTPGSGTVPSSRPGVPTSARAPAKDVPTRFDAVGDPLPPGAVARLGTVRLRHAGRVTTVACLPDGKTVVSGSPDGTVRFWDAATGKELGRFPGDHLTLSPDGKSWASWTASGKDTNQGKESKIRLWDLTTGKQLREFIRPQDTYAVAFSPDGKVLAAGGLDGEKVNQLSFWEVATGKELPAPQLGGEYDYVHHLSFSPDGKVLATAGETDGEVRLWDLATGKETEGSRAWKDGSATEQFIVPFAFSPEGKIVASCGKRVGGRYEFPARSLRDIVTGKELRRFESPGIGRGTALLFSTTGDTLVSGEQDGSICVWEAATGKLLRTLKGHHGIVTCLALSRDGKTLVSGSADHTLRLWDFATGKPLLPEAGHSKPIVSAGLSPDNRTVISASGDLATGGDRTIRLWDLTSGKETRRLASAPIRSAALAPNGKLLATACRVGVDRSATKVSLWDLDTGKPLHQLLETTTWPSFAFSPDSKTLAVSMSPSVVLFDTATGKQSARVDDIPEKQLSDSFVAFSPDGKTLAWVGPGTCRVLEAATGKQLHNFTIRSRPDAYAGVSWAAFLDGQTLLLQIDGSFCRWDLASGSGLDRIPHASGQAALSRDGKTLATGAADGTIRLWDVATGKERHTLRGHQRAESYSGVTALAWSVDGTRLVSGGADTTVLVWDLSTLK